MGLTGFQSLKISDVKVLKLIQENPTNLYYKRSYKDEEFMEVKLCRKKKSIPMNYTLKRAYNSAIKIKENKKKDLLNLLENNHIPKYYLPFFNALFNE